MKKFKRIKKASNQSETFLKFRGVDYSFIMKNGDIYIRRSDDNVPDAEEVAKLNDYIVSEFIV